MIRVVLVDDQELVRTGFRLVLRGAEGVEVVGEAADGRRALDLLETVEADVVVMDVRMPEMDGLEATRRLCARGPLPKVLILTTFDLDEYVFDALKAGASGFLLKDTAAHSLIEAIRVVHAGDSVIAPSVTRRLITRFIPRLPGRDDAPDERASRLSPREREVLAEIAAGLSNAEIAERMYLSEGTVRTHVSRILSKLGLRDRVQAVVFAYENGLTQPG
ncbi:response regulator [Bailinhaonella thermotolerans]|uniref:DNA-binding response regulator n=1 Tax=Bailinhaonella thermotolerans TaxID=1070861 RepID=A0A3A4AU58_9ACTN|nr:response regulator transcription factor [Bailinhaonella thermotolerans]RJL31835.1 DNA-binding response regulator [Bailinhaonella thermotolerans]